LSVCASLIGACTGSARVEVTPLDFRQIDPPSPRAAVLTVPECYWWQEDDGHVHVALGRTDRSWLVPRWVGLKFRMSLVLEQLPAGHARNYLAGQRELRAIVQVGPTEGRFASVNGIVALYREGSDQLRGSFRLTVQRETTRLLGGWGPPVLCLMQGEFVAVRNAEAGRKISGEVADTGWPAPTSQPAPRVRPVPQSGEVRLED
jgi:hypothetical protein